MTINTDIRFIARHQVQVEGLPIPIAYDRKHPFAIGRYICVECCSEVYHIVRDAFTHSSDACKEPTGFVGDNIVYVIGDQEDEKKHADASLFKGWDMKKLLEIAKKQFGSSV